MSTTPQDIDAAVHLTIQSAFITAGQRCTCARRLLVKRGDKGDAFLERLVTVSQTTGTRRLGCVAAAVPRRLISPQAAQKVHQAWLGHVAKGGKTLLEPRLLRAGTSLLTPGIIELTNGGGSGR
ncbi:N-succinylglutamate 5-semialdehyde dehydrogenase [Raoultella planticola]|uniref:N-succinylglutamate 5-semialdehyde dehydrogenase n=1 Tax=Raoultella planticola TaxID=575 RepID=A0A485CEP9_RAOPL|nr:N-succinylglutamate 5-semialdehyde dehydrogenase [Raoultella planticola]